MTSENTLFTLREARAMNRTISDIYNCASKGPSVDALSDLSLTFINNLHEQINFDKGNIMFYTYNKDIDAYEVSSFFQTGWKDDDLDSYLHHYCHFDDILPILSANKEIAFMNGSIFSFRESTQYFKEFVKPAQIVNSVDANILLQNSNGLRALLGFFRNSEESAFSAKEFEIIKSYQPHLSNAFSQMLTAPSATQNIDELLFTLSKFEAIGLCTLSFDLKLMSFNRTFKECLNRGTVADNPLLQRFREICSNLKNSNLETCEKFGPTTVTIDNESFVIEILPCNGYSPSAKFVCLVLPDDFHVKLQKFQSIYSLSARECEIIDIILKKGLSNEEISASLYISSSTVKKHLTSIYSKVGVKNQKQLSSLFQKF